MKAISYLRVSTAGQGRSGLGLESQEAAVAALCKQKGAELLQTFVEVESGGRADRPQLTAALSLARLTGATLVIAKLDRLSRNAAFLLALRDSGVAFIAADMPDANAVTVGVMAVIAEEERRAISERTKAALAAVKARGQRLGNPNGAAALRRAGKGTAAALKAVKAKADTRAAALKDAVAEARAGGAVSLGDIALALNAKRIQAPRGGVWHPTSVRRLLARLT